MRPRTLIQNKRISRAARGIAAGTVLCSLLLAIGMLFVLWAHNAAYEAQLARERAEHTAAEPFPLGVDPKQQLITEQPAAEAFYRKYIAGTLQQPEPQRGWLANLMNAVGHMAFVQNLASPASRVLVIEPGERHEQVVDNFGDILSWDEGERAEFRRRVASATPPLPEGKYFPERYVAARDATPLAVATQVNEVFDAEVLRRYTPEIQAAIPLAETLTMASLIEREAYSFEDMRSISGVIWNRRFIGMPLQLDASLQYVKGSRPYGPWWPRVAPRDKFLSSPFNTYEHEGLPPAPIANPSLAAIVAALNPKATDCLYYFHNNTGEFFCSKDYETHLEFLRSEYGRGR